MPETTITIEDAARCLPEIVDRVCGSGETALLTKSGVPRARIVPATVPSASIEDLIAFLRRWRFEHPEPDDQLAQAIQNSRSLSRSR